MNRPAHKTTPQNHAVSCSFSYSDSNIAEVESRAGKHTLPRRSDVADCNGKEKDWESGFHYYGARYYWSELLTGWLSVDPIADKYPSMSPYNYCAWNPVKIVDPDGRDTLLFSWDNIKNRGYYEKTLPGGDNNIGIIKGKNGRVIKEFTFADDRYCSRFRNMDDLDMAAENNTIKDPDQKLFNSVILVNPGFIESKINEAGANKWYRRHMPFMGMGYALFQSRGDKGKLDFVNDSRIQNLGKSLFVTTVDGMSTAHDLWNFGNFLWGAAMGRMNIPPSLVYIGSNGDNLMHHFPYLDSPDDQKSIWMGYKYGRHSPK